MLWLGGLVRLLWAKNVRKRTFIRAQSLFGALTAPLLLLLLSPIEHVLHLIFYHMGRILPANKLRSMAERRCTRIRIRPFPGDLNHEGSLST